MVPVGLLNFKPNFTGMWHHEALILIKVWALPPPSWYKVRCLNIHHHENLKFIHYRVYQSTPLDTAFS